MLNFNLLLYLTKGQIEKATIEDLYLSCRSYLTPLSANILITRVLPNKVAKLQIVRQGGMAAGEKNK